MAPMLRRPALSRVLVLLIVGCAPSGQEPVKEWLPGVGKPSSEVKPGEVAPRGAPIGDGKRPIPDAKGDTRDDMALDGRKAPDHAELRHTHAKDGWEPIADRMKGERIEVGSVKEFVQALGSKRTIVFRPGVYVWRDADVLGYFDAKTGELYDGLSPHFRAGAIQDVHDLTITSEGDGARILQPDPYDHVLSFVDVERVTLYNLVLGHHNDAGWCRGGVVRVIGGRDLVLDGLGLFGSGTEGLTLTDVQDLELRSSAVWGCTEQLSTFANATGIVVRDTAFVDNGGPTDGRGPLLRGFLFSRASVRFERVTLRGNHSNAGADAGDGSGSLFTVDPDHDVAGTILYDRVPKRRVTGPRTSQVEFIDATLADNTFARAADKPAALRIRGPKGEGAALLDPGQPK